MEFARSDSVWKPRKMGEIVDIDGFLRLVEWSSEWRIDMKNVHTLHKRKQNCLKAD